MTDALFNKGISGGVVLAIRDGVPNFELVGMAKSVSTSNEFYLRPDIGHNTVEYDLTTPYEGNVFVSTGEMIKYGVTYVISMEKLRTFFEEHKEEIHRQGYYPDPFFIKQIQRPVK
ncbi:MAG: hypothetical protein FJY10_04970 [Bacteroidetes bacterium]|nr:hypothetical protein [Bacteroidota bacterium]